MKKPKIKDVWEYIKVWFKPPVKLMSKSKFTGGSKNVSLKIVYKLI